MVLSHWRERLPENSKSQGFEFEFYKRLKNSHGQYRCSAYCGYLRIFLPCHSTSVYNCGIPKSHIETVHGVGAAKIGATEVLSVAWRLR